MKLIEQHQIFGGSQQVWAHHAQTLQCEMKFAVYLPDNQENRPLGVIYLAFRLNDVTVTKFHYQIGLSALCGRTSSDCGCT